MFSTYSSVPKFINCILWGNTPHEVYVASDPPIMAYCNIQGGWAGVGNINVAPRFVDADGPDNDPATWEDNDYHLSLRSPCVNAGDPAGSYTGQVDMDGEDRVMGSRVDIGADELFIGVEQPEPVPPRPGGGGVIPGTAGEAATGKPRLDRGIADSRPVEPEIDTSRARCGL